MISLAATSMESYHRSYPSLCRLHVLHEMEAGFSLTRDEQRERAESVPHDWHWPERLRNMSDSLSQRTQLLAVRRAILGLNGFSREVALQWLDLSSELRHLGRFDSARVALKNAEQFGVDAEQALLEDCRIMKEQGQAQKALRLLEPSEINLQAIMVSCSKTICSCKLSEQISK